VVNEKWPVKSGIKKKSKKGQNTGKKVTKKGKKETVSVCPSLPVELN